MPHQREKKMCTHTGCERPARARGFCERHYRQRIRAYRRGTGGTEPEDTQVFKLRILLPSGATQPVYYSRRGDAYRRAEKERARGALLFFGTYRRVDTDDTV